jgi:DNA-binding response OmpR family regulator
MMVIANDLAGELIATLPGVVVVDPRFDAYTALAASARMGKIDLHMRSSGSGALKLADRIHVDAWLIATELDDMSGEDFVGLLQARRGDAKIAMIDEAAAGSRHFALAEQAGREAGVDMVMSSPITVADLEETTSVIAGIQPLSSRRSSSSHSLAQSLLPRQQISSRSSSASSSSSSPATSWPATQSATHSAQKAP